MPKSGSKKAKKPHWNDLVVRAAFASILVQRRRELKLKQHEIAYRSGYSEKYISMLERRINTPSLTAALMISDALGFDPTEVLGRVRSLMPRFKRLERKDRHAADV